MVQEAVGVGEQAGEEGQVEAPLVKQSSLCLGENSGSQILSTLVSRDIVKMPMKYSIAIINVLNKIH